MSCRSDLPTANMEGQSGDCSSFASERKKDEMGGTMVQRIGNVLYTVHVRPAENAEDDYDAKLRKRIEQDVIARLNDEKRKEP